MLKHFDVIQKLVPSKDHFNNKKHYKCKNVNNSSFGVGVIKILPEGGSNPPPLPPNLNRVKDQKSADVVRKQLGDLGTKINQQLQLVFTSKKIADHLRVTEENFLP